MRPQLILLLFPLAIVGLTHAEPRRPITATDLVGIRDIGGHHFGAMSVSPDRDYVAFQLQTPIIEEGNYKLTWYVAETTPAGNVWAVGDGGEVTLNPEMRSTTNGNRPAVTPLWSPDGKWIIYTKRLNETTQIWRSRRDGSVQEQLTHIKGDVLRSASGGEAVPRLKLSKTGDAILFATAQDAATTSKQLSEEARTGYLFDDRFRPGLTKAPFVRTCGFSDRGRPQEVKWSRSCKPKIWIYEFEKKSARLATKEEIETYYSSADSPPNALDDRAIRMFRESEEMDSVLWLENEDSKSYPGYIVPVRLFASVHGEEFRCDAEECEGFGGVIEGAWWRPGTNEIIFQRADGSNMSMTSFYAWTPGSKDVRTILQTDDLLASCEIISESRLACLREQWTHPRTIVSVNLNHGRMQTIYDPNPEFDSFKFSRIELIEWEDTFGAPTHGHLVYPLNYRKGRRYPLVITTYRSRGFLRGGVGDEYPIHLFAAKGFMVLSHDKPRSLKRFATIADSGQAEHESLHKRVSTLSAQERVLHLLAERGLIELRRTAITGTSDGGEQVRFALTHTNSFTTGIASSAFDYRAHYYLSNRNWRSYWERMFAGPPYEDEAGYWRALSLGLNADKMDEPYLANVSDGELLLSVETVARLQEAGQAIEMYVFPDEYHIKWQPQHRLAIYRRNVQWMLFWLKGVEVDDPVDPEQYLRWRKMRDKRCAREDGYEPIYCNRINSPATT